MRKMAIADAAELDRQEPWSQNGRLGTFMYEHDNSGVFYIAQTIPAGVASSVTNLTLNTLMGNDTLFDFELLTCEVRTETAVASSTVTFKAGSNAVSDAMVSAVQWAITRANQIVGTYNKFFPLSNPAGYAAAPLNFVDAGGATAPQRTIFCAVRKL